MMHTKQPGGAALALSSYRPDDINVRGNYVIRHPEARIARRMASLRNNPANSLIDYFVEKSESYFPKFIARLRTLKLKASFSLLLFVIGI